jgi:hypothetical protein
MSESKARYSCVGFTPIEADNVVHAGFLFALQITRREHGPMARCTRLDLKGSIRPDGATFEAVAGIPPRGEPYQFSVCIDHCYPSTRPAYFGRCR